MRRYEDEALLAQLRNLARKLGRTPSMTDLEKARGPKPSTYFVRFGSFCAAQERAGLVPTKVPKPERDQEVVERFKNGESTAELSRAFRVSRQRISQILYKHGERPKDIRKYRDQDLLMYLLFLAEAEGKPPAHREVLRYGFRSPIIRRFGSLGEAREQVGLPRKLSTGRRRLRYSHEFLLEHLRTLAQRLAHTPGQRDLNLEPGPKMRVYYERFGSLTRAQELAGLQPNIVGHKRRSLTGTRTHRDRNDVRRGK